MKKSRLIAWVCVLTCVMTLIVPAFAVTERASDQIKLYMMDTIVTKGTISIEFSITGKGLTDKLGCESIYLYKKVGTAWVYTDSKGENDDGMSKTNKINHANTITFSGTAGVEYMVVVTVFAENSAGRDTRSETFFVTGK